MSRVSRARAQRTSLGWLSLKRQASASAGSCALAATSSMHLAPSAVEMATSTTPQHELECTRTRRRRGRRDEAGRQCERETCNMPQARRTNCQHTHRHTHARAACSSLSLSYPVSNFHSVPKNFPCARGGFAFSFSFAFSLCFSFAFGCAGVGPKLGRCLSYNSSTTSLRGERTEN